jgi:hypothetical protein
VCFAFPLHYKQEAQGVLRDQESDGYYKPEQSIGATNQVLKTDIYEIKSFLQLTCYLYRKLIGILCSLPDVLA